ncbi:ankyrin repeat-containing domain-containing LTR copia-type protein, partial [Tanacetum coccineum]
ETKAEAETNTETKDVDVVSAQTSKNGGDAVSIDVESEAAEEEAATIKMFEQKYLRVLAMKGDWSAVESILKEDNNLVREAISSDGSTILHIAVGIGNKDFVKNLFSYITEEDVLATRNDGSTALHIAAIVGNKYAADLLLKKNEQCLRIKDEKGQEPFHKAYEYMHLDTIGYLLKVIQDDGKSDLHIFSVEEDDDKIGVDLLVNAISAKKYKLASDLIKKFPKFASKNDHVLMAIAKTFPSGDYGATNAPYSWKDYWEILCESVHELFMARPGWNGLIRVALEMKSSLIEKIVLICVLIVPALLIDVFFFLFGLILILILMLTVVLYFTTISLGKRI